MRGVGKWCAKTALTCKSFKHIEWIHTIKALVTQYNTQGKITRVIWLMTFVIIVISPQVITTVQAGLRPQQNMPVLMSYQWHLVDWPKTRQNIRVHDNTNTQQSVNGCDISGKMSRKTTHSSPVRARYWVSFVNAKSDRSCIIVPVVLCVLSCYRWPRWYIQSLEYIITCTSGKGKYTYSSQTVDNAAHVLSCHLSSSIIYHFCIHQIWYL